jgi:hypothetical protein
MTYFERFCLVFVTILAVFILFDVGTLQHDVSAIKATLVKVEK